MRGKHRTVLFFSLFLVLLAFGFLQSGVCGDVFFDGNFDVDVKIYVLALDGVGFSAVEDFGRMVEGVLQACHLSIANGSILYPWLPGFLEYREVRVNESVDVVSDWSVYKQIVEYEEKVIVVNAHGEVLPVPTGYSQEGWIAKLAEALLNRQVTWAHTAGYPFNYTWQQGDNKRTDLGHNGFRTFMSHIGLNVTGVDCLPPGSLKTRISQNTDAGQNLLPTWLGLGQASWVDRGYPLNGSVFQNYTVQSIWGLPDTYLTGGTIAYGDLNTSDYGFYTHVGTLQTYDSSNPPEPTDADFLRGYVAAASSICSVAFYEAGKESLALAEEAILTAEDEGRTEGLQEARDLLEEARGYWGPPYDGLSTLVEAVYYSIIKAENAQTPNLLQQYGVVIVGTVTAGIAATALIAKLRNRKETTKQYEES